MRTVSWIIFLNISKTQSWPKLFVCLKNSIKFIISHCILKSFFLNRNIHIYDTRLLPSSTPGICEWFSKIWLKSRKRTTRLISLRYWSFSETNNFIENRAMVEEWQRFIGAMKVVCCTMKMLANILDWSLGREEAGVGDRKWRRSLPLPFSFPPDMRSFESQRMSIQWLGGDYESFVERKDKCDCKSCWYIRINNWARLTSVL